MHDPAITTDSAFPDMSATVQITRKRLQVDATRIDLEGLSLHRQHFGAGFQLRTTVAPDTGLLGFVESDTSRVVQHGAPWPSNAFTLVSSAGLDLFSLSPATVIWLEFPLSRATLQPELRDAIVNDHSDEFVDIGESLSTSLRDSAMEIFRAHERFGRYGQADLQAHARLRAILLRALTNARRIPRRPSIARRYELIVRAERFAAQHMDKAITLETIGAELGCSARTLIYAFKQAFGIGPMAYFKLQRLNAVHRELIAAPEPRRISELAPRFGFWHMGHFSTDYRLMFGRPPSHSRPGRD